MRLITICGTWGLDASDPQAFCARAAEVGYDAISTRLNPSIHWRPALEAHHLELAVMMSTHGSSPKAHIASAMEQFDAMEAHDGPIRLVNSQTGSDLWTLEQNLPIFDAMQRRAESLGLTLFHETHRQRPTFTLPQTLQLLELRPQLQLTADFSHWCCVHGTMLEGLEDQLEKVFPRVGNIHTRVGFSEGPQIPDPRAPEWKGNVEIHLGWWKRIHQLARESEREFLGLHPEFGPFPYMPREPHTQRDLADLFEVNAHMREKVLEAL